MYEVQLKKNVCGNITYSQNINDLAISVQRLKSDFTGSVWTTEKLIIYQRSLVTIDSLESFDDSNSVKTIINYESLNHVDHRK